MFMTDFSNGDTLFWDAYNPSSLMDLSAYIGCCQNILECACIVFVGGESHDQEYILSTVNQIAI